MRTQVPGSVRAARWLLWGLVGLGALSTLATMLFRDDLVLTWAEGNPEAREVVARGGLAALEDSAINIPAFVPLALALFAVFACLVWVLGALFGTRHNWARTSLALMAVFVVFASAMAMTLGLPALFVVLFVVTIVASVALLAALYHKDTTTFLGPS